MHEYSELFIGLDTSKAKISVAVAEKERNGEVRFFGDISAEPTWSCRWWLSWQSAGPAFTSVIRLARPGTTGYDLYRQIIALEHERHIVAPSLIPERPHDRVS